MIARTITEHAIEMTIIAPFDNLELLRNSAESSEKQSFPSIASFFKNVEDCERYSFVTSILSFSEHFSKIESTFPVD